MPEKITLDEIKEILQKEDVKPQRVFSEEKLLSDPTVRLNIEKAAKDGKIPEGNWQEKEEEAKKKEEEKIKAEVEKKIKEKEEEIEEDDLIPDDNYKGEPGEAEELIPD